VGLRLPFLESNRKAELSRELEDQQGQSENGEQELWVSVR